MSAAPSAVRATRELVGEALEAALAGDLVRVATDDPLTVAAPDLLECCQKSLAWLNFLAAAGVPIVEHLPNNFSRDMLRRAIARAEGVITDAR